MPIIKLLPKPGPLPNAPAAVLDNAKRPTVDRRAEQQALGNLGQSFEQKPLDAGALTQDTKALGAVGHAIAQAGDVMGAVAMKLRQAQTDKQVMDGELTARDMLAAHDRFMDENQMHPEEWGGNLDKTTVAMKDALDANKKLHPEARRQLELKLSSYSANARIATGKAATKQTFNLTKSAYEAKSITMDSERNYEGGLANMEEAHKKGYVYDHELAAYKSRQKDMQRQDERQDEADKHRQDAQRYTAASNLVVAQTRHKGKDAALKDIDEQPSFDDLSPTDKQQLRRVADSVGRDMEANTIDQISRGIADGTLNSQQSIDALLTNHASPAVRAAAKEMINNLHRDQMREDKAGESGIKNSVALHELIQEYDPKQDKDRKKYFEIDMAIKARAGSGNENDLQKELMARLGVDSSKIKAGDPIKRNITESIRIVYDPFTGALPWKSKVRVKGKVEPVTVIDKDKQKAALDAMTKVEIYMNKWVEMNPVDAKDLNKVQAALDKAMPQGTKASALSNMSKALSGEGQAAPAGNAYQYDDENESTLPPSQPGMGAEGEEGPAGDEPPNYENQPGAEGETGPAGVAFTRTPVGTRVTSYAYEGEETPDSNSAAGIGAFVPESEQAKIKAGGRSFYRLREGDFAVSPDVEKALDKAGIDPMDTVIIKFSDGSTQRGRWADRTSASLRGRWDFYQGGKTVKHGKEGRRVISFKRG
jgi:hypothetical protein